ncbi:protein of unknown function [Ruminobacter amylophilus]|uniref:Carbohydrate-binding domain-containing protein n=2 Tax=Ruminobacter TaxID=866 RepID=A0A662ZFL8_9GAMM|nr:carbohydrate-binding domain-containing protein [Ruminobacter amylophilus]SFP04874.1 protein of unknown function [Ruminobacter amylophilus]
MINLESFQKSLLAVIISASLTASLTGCGASASSDGTEISIGDDSGSSGNDGSSDGDSSGDDGSSEGGASGDDSSGDGGSSGGGSSGGDDSGDDSSGDGGSSGGGSSGSDDSGSGDSDSGDSGSGDSDSGDSGSGDSDSGDSDGDESGSDDSDADDEDLSSYGTPAVKADLFSGYTGDYGNNATDESLPVFSDTIYINLSDLTFSTDNSEFSSILKGTETAVIDGVSIVRDGKGYITVDASGTSDSIKFVLSGTLTKGTVDITAKKNASVGVELNGVDITSGNNPAVVVGPKTATAYVILKGTNYLTDGRIFGIGYSKANGTDYYDSSVDSSVDVSEASMTQKWALGSDDNGVISTKGIFRISGDGILNISTAYKHGVYAKNRLYVYGGQIGVKNSGRNGLQSKNGFDMFGGTINIEGVGNHTNKQSRGIIVSGDESEDGAGLGGMNFVDGVVNITTVGKAISAKWDIEDDAETTETTDDPSPVVKISGGTFNITTSGQVIDSDRSQNTVSYYDEDGILTTEAEKCSPEGIEGKLGLEISGGTFNINTTDDALNASRDGSAYINISGGSLYLNASSADAIDSNGDINISGGVIVSVATMGSEDGFDCDGKLTFTGGVAVGISGSNHEYASTGSSTTTQNTFVIGSSYLGSQNTVMAIMDSSDNPVFVFKLPSTSYSLATVSSPNLAAADTYGVYSGVTVSGGTEFRGLYTVMPSVSGGSLTGSVTTNDSTHVYTSLSQGGGSFGPGAGGGEPPSFPGGR